MKKIWCQLKVYAVIVLCALLLAGSYHIFIFPNQFAPAGIPGIATIIQYLFHFKVGYLTMIVNVPLLLLTFFIVGRKFAIRSAVFAAVFSVTLLLLDYVPLEPYLYHTANGTSTILAPVVAGVISGFCYGCVMRLGGSTGGTDLVAALIHEKRPQSNLIWIIFAINVVVAAVSYVVYDFKIEPVILCMAYCFMSSRVSDTMLKGFKEAVKFEIVTDQPEELSKALIERLKHSVTEVPAVGGFTHQNKTVLICVVNKHQIVEFQRVIQHFPNSFAYLTSVKETMGNFKKIKS